MSKVVIDSSALLAYIKKEPGAEALIDILPHAFISTINYSEVATIILALGMPRELVESTLMDLVGELVDFNQSQAILAASLRQSTKSKGLSLGDRACIALGIELQLPIYTADKIWKELNIKDADIRLIR